MVRSPTTMDLVLGGTRLKVGTDGSRRRGAPWPPGSCMETIRRESGSDSLGAHVAGCGDVRASCMYNTRAFVPTSLCLVSCFYNTDVGRKFLPGRREAAAGVALITLLLGPLAALPLTPVNVRFRGAGSTGR